MRSIAILLLAIAAIVPAEAKTVTKTTKKPAVKKAATSQSATPKTVSLSNQPEQKQRVLLGSSGAPQDSPLVRAAKSSRASQEKAKVSINGANLVRFGRSHSSDTYGGAPVSYPAATAGASGSAKQTDRSGAAAAAPSATPTRAQQAEELNTQMSKLHDAELDPTAYEMNEDDVSRGLTETQQKLDAVNNSTTPNP